MQHLVLVHGAVGSPTQLKPLADLLSDKFRVHTPGFRGHGGIPGPDAFSFDGFTEDIEEFLAEKKIEKCLLFGYSMGGYAALKFAAIHPEKVSGIITLATKFEWTPEIAAKETAMLNPAVIEEKVPGFAAALENLHAPLDWKEQLSYTKDLLMSLGKNNRLTLADHKEITTPCLLMLGDRDKMVTLGETVDVYTALPAGAMAVLPQTPHPIEKIDLQLLRFHIEQFLR